MSYKETLIAAGARVIAFKEFGSYQGTWLALVEYNGETGIVEGHYGSCSGCDHFQASFGWDDKPSEENGKYYKNCWTWDEDNECTKEEYDSLQAKYEKKFADFGADYLRSGLYDRAHYEAKIAKLKEDDWFDGETKENCEWALQQFDLATTPPNKNI